MRREVEISRTGREGQGVGTDGEGNLYFVPGAVPGDRVEVEVRNPGRRYRDGELIRVTRPSPQRVEALCPHFRECGGCDWLHWAYPAQLSAKQATLEHVLRRGGWEPETRLPAFGAARTSGYRSRVQVHFRHGKWGFFRRGSHSLVEVEDCYVADPRINAALRELRQTTPEEGTTVELLLSRDGEVFLSRKRGEAAFTQVNPEQNEGLRRSVRSLIEASGAEKVLELYCGDGNLTFAYRPVVASVFAFDSSEAAIGEARARASAESGPGGNVVFVTDTVDAKLPRKLPSGFRDQYDTLVLDPPRTGVGKDFHKFIHDNLKQVVYVSCSPIAFTKDVECLKDQFRFRSVQLIDMFPHTRHIEFVAWFTRC